MAHGMQIVKNSIVGSRRWIFISACYVPGALTNDEWPSLYMGTAGNTLYVFDQNMSKFIMGHWGRKIYTIMTDDHDSPVLHIETSIAFWFGKQHSVIG
jgi:hypothetical protein